MRIHLLVLVRATPEDGDASLLEYVVHGEQDPDAAWIAASDATEAVGEPDGPGPWIWSGEHAPGGSVLAGEWRRLTSAEAAKWCQTGTLFQGESKWTPKAQAPHNTNTAEAVASGWRVTGDPDVWQLVCKASNAELGIEKSTKRMRVADGWLYQVSTRTPMGVAEALAYVPAPAPG